MKWLRHSAVVLLGPVLLAACDGGSSTGPGKQDPDPTPPPIQTTPEQPDPPPPPPPTNPPPTPPSNSREGTLGFAVSGAITGTFDARGEFRTGSSTQTNSFAVATGTASRLSIVAFHLVSPPRGNVFLLELRNAQSGGSIPITTREQCDGQSTAPCAYGVLILDREPETEVIDVRDPSAFNLTSGSVTLTEVTDQRVSGVFSAQATQGSTGRVISLASGGFNIPLIAGQQSGG